METIFELASHEIDDVVGGNFDPTPIPTDPPTVSTDPPPSIEEQIKQLTLY